MASSPPLPNPQDFQGILDNISKMQETFTPSTCQPAEPLIDFSETGHPPAIDFNLPQSTAFTTYGKINVPISENYFKAFTKIAPSNNYWNVIENMTEQQVNALLYPGVTAQPQLSVSGMFISQNRPDVDYRAERIKPGAIPALGGFAGPINKDNYAPQAIPLSLTQLQNNTTVLSQLAKQGLRPILIKRINNRAPITKFVAKPPVPKPQIIVVEEYSTTSYLGNYGAGRVVKTMSLMPGERTSISVRTYKDMESTRETAQNILDSFSNTSATELDTLMQKEQGDMSSTSDTSAGTNSGFATHTDAHNSQKSWDVSANISVFGFGAGGGYGQSSSDASSNSSGWNNSASYSHTGARTSNINTINNALTKHVQSSNSNRQININTSTTDTARSGEEDITVREIQNYNKSRVLNFIFRQLLQEYTVITALVNLKFVYTNGYPESFTMVDLNNLDNMLTDLIQDGPDPNNKEQYRNEVKCALLKHYCNVLDYNDQEQAFLDHKQVTVGGCLGQWLGQNVCPPTTESYWRVLPGLSQTYDPTGVNIKVPGVILSVKKQTLLTSSVIADALLGRGEALDCFNQKAQDADSMAAYISNMSAMQRLSDNIQTSAVNLDIANQQLELGDQQIELSVKQVEMSDKQIEKMSKENQVMEQQMSLLDEITDPAEKAAAYKKVFGTCCPTPQYTGGCGCGNCGDGE